MAEILNRTTAPQIVRFFDVCFKAGVIDAYSYGDDLSVKEFYEQKMSDWTFGSLNTGDVMDWKSFQFVLYWWARKYHMKSLAENYIFKIRTVSYQWCLLPYCMRFYLMGVKEWLDYPSPANIEVFKTLRRAHWSPTADVKAFTRGDYFSHLHDFAFHYRKLPEETKIATDTAMDTFVKALFDLSQKY